MAITVNYVVLGAGSCDPGQPPSFPEWRTIRNNQRNAMERFTGLAALNSHAVDGGHDSLGYSNLFGYNFLSQSQINDTIFVTDLNGQIYLVPAGSSGGSGFTWGDITVAAGGGVTWMNLHPYGANATRFCPRSISEPAWLATWTPGYMERPLSGPSYWVLGVKTAQTPNAGAIIEYFHGAYGGAPKLRLQVSNVSTLSVDPVQCYAPSDGGFFSDMP